MRIPVNNFYNFITFNQGRYLAQAKNIQQLNRSWFRIEFSTENLY